MEDDKSKMDETITKYKLPIAAGVVGLVLLVGGVISSGIIPKTFVKSSPSLSSSVKASNPQLSLIKIDVSGAVISPGVVSVKGDARVEDAIKAAGGVSSLADPAYLTQTLNLAQKVGDGMKIYIPFAGEKANNLGTSSSLGSETSTININTASIADLDKLSGVGAVTAQKIIDGRPYQGIEELVSKKAVSKSVFDKIKDKISVY